METHQLGGRVVLKRKEAQHGHALCAPRERGANGDHIMRRQRITCINRSVHHELAAMRLWERGNGFKVDHRLRDGRNGGFAVRIVFADGRTLEQLPQAGS